MDNETTEVTMVLHHTTDKAVLVSDTGEEKDAIWLPKSQCEIEIQKNNMVEVTLPVWLAQKHGLI